MTSRLIESGLSDRPSSPVRAKKECCKSHDLWLLGQGLLRHQNPVLKHYELPPTANRLPHWVRIYPFAEVQLAYSTAPADKAIIFRELVKIPFRQVWCVHNIWIFCFQLIDLWISKGIHLKELIFRVSISSSAAIVKWAFASILQKKVIFSVLILFHIFKLEEV